MSNFRDTWMIHAGGTEVPRAKLEDEGIIPATTRSYTPVPHNIFANMVEDSLRNAGFEIGEQLYALGREGKTMFGVAELLNEGLTPDTYRLVAGFRSSYDKSTSAGFVIGSQVFVCDNGCFSGDIKVGRKHTTNVMRDLPYQLFQATAGIRDMAAKQNQRYEKYQEVEMKDNDASHVIIEMVKRNIIPSSKVEQVINEYWEPTHDEHKVDSKHSNWTLFNATTEALKGSGSLGMLSDRTIKLHTLMDEASEFELPLAA